MSAQEKAECLIKQFKGDAFELTEIKVRELEIELKYWKQVLEEINKK
mgnify:CR=1 FL=1